MEEWWPFKIASEIMWFFTVLMVALVLVIVFFVFMYCASLWYKHFKIYFLIVPYTNKCLSDKTNSVNIILSYIVTYKNVIYGFSFL